MTLRQVSIAGAPKIGEGSHGEVYRIAEDMIVKVYRSDISMETIQKEKYVSKSVELSDMKEKTIGWIGNLGKYLPSDACEKLMELMEKVLDSHMLLHADSTWNFRPFHLRRQHSWESPWKPQEDILKNL